MLLKSFVANLKSSSPTIRRTAASSAVSVCQHSRRASYFYTWLLNVLLGRRHKHPHSHTYSGRRTPPWTLTQLCTFIPSSFQVEIRTRTQIYTPGTLALFCNLTWAILNHTKRVLFVLSAQHRFCFHWKGATQERVGQTWVGDIQGTKLAEACAIPVEFFHCFSALVMAK